MNSIILLVFEGERPETQIFDSIRKHFFQDDSKTVLYTIYGAEIFQLWKEIEKDKDLELPELLRERNNKNLEGISREDISEVHLFFDHEAHSHPTVSDYDATTIHEMLVYFDNETLHGKLYVSYPMIEAVKDCGSCLDRRFECLAYISDNLKYKSVVHSRSAFQSIRDLSADDWRYLFAVNVLRTNKLLYGEYGGRDYRMFVATTQKEIHDKELELFIRPRRAVAILSAVPFFVLGYFGERLYDSLRIPELLKDCDFYA